MGDKVFCKYCKYVRDEFNTSTPHTNCAYPENLGNKWGHRLNTFYEPHILRGRNYERTANDINAYNDCEWYKHSFWKGWF